MEMPHLRIPALGCACSRSVKSFPWGVTAIVTVRPSLIFDCASLRRSKLLPFLSVNSAWVCPLNRATPLWIAGAGWRVLCFVPERICFLETRRLQTSRLTAPQRMRIGISWIHLFREHGAFLGYISKHRRSITLFMADRCVQIEFVEFYLFGGRPGLWVSHPHHKTVKSSNICGHDAGDFFWRHSERSTHRKCRSLV